MAASEQRALVDSCYLVKCVRCGKTSWDGCGMHVQSVMKDVKDEEKCDCPKEDDGWCSVQ